MKTTLHSPALIERWNTMSLPEQLGNIGSEIHRMVTALSDERRFILAKARATELLMLTLADTRWSATRIKELTALNNQFKQSTENQIDSTELNALDTYCFQFGMLAAITKGR
ncbi:MAG: hypothetical protein AAB343_03175 [Patescibacteria group bacterium]